MDKSIVVAVDGSPHSLDGVRYAAPLARAMGAQLELAFVMPPNLLLPNIYPEAHRRVEEANAARADDVLSRAKQVAAEAGVSAVGIRLSDGTADSVAELAKADRVWAVVAGARGHNALARVMLGSFADRLVHVCPKPVLLIR
jgi:nucleotide-binding universal stress UspA family protein